MNRLIIVHNPRASKHALIKNEVLIPATRLKGYTIGKFEVKPISVDDNSTNLSKLLLDGDLIIAAGGDGTSAVALNGAMLSQKDVTLAVLGFGNFNDFSRTLGYKSLSEIIADYESTSASSTSSNATPTINSQINSAVPIIPQANSAKPNDSQNAHLKTLYPLEAIVDGKHFRYAACYFTIGMFAESTEIFDQKPTRTSLRTGKKGLFFSIFTLAKWYFKHKKEHFLPDDVLLNNSPVNNIKPLRSGKKTRVSGGRVSDILFVNGKTVAKIMRGSSNWWGNSTDYCLSVGKLSSFFRLISFMAKSFFCRIPGNVVAKTTTVTFPTPSEIEIQAEGEYRKLKMQNLTIQKSKQGIKVLAK